MKNQFALSLFVAATSIGGSYAVTKYKAEKAQKALSQVSEIKGDMKALSQALKDTSQAVNNLQKDVRVLNSALLNHRRQLTQASKD